MLDPVASLLVRGALALLFAAAAWHKLRSPRRFAAILAAYRLLPHWLVAAAAVLVPFLEVVVAAGLPFEPTRRAAALAGIVLLLGLALAAAASGWSVYNDLGGDWLEEAHEFLAGAMLAIVGVHLAGVALSSWLHRENLVGAMLTGRKPAPRRAP